MKLHHILTVMSGGIFFAVVGFSFFVLRYPEDTVAYTNTDFVASSDGDSFAFDSATNVLIGSFRLPDPVTDILLHDGLANTVIARSTLANFPSTNQMYDTNGDGMFGGVEGIVQSSDTTIDSTDVVLMTASGALTSIPTVDGAGLIAYLDQGATVDSYDSGEDIYREVYNGVNSAITSGNTIRLFPNPPSMMDTNANGVVDFNGVVNYQEALVADLDTNGRPSSGDSVIVGGTANIRVFVSGDGVCFDGSIVNDTEFDVGERVWKDAAGDCSSFTSGVDSILLTANTPTGTSTVFGTENEVAYLDIDASGTFTCTRTGTCEPLVSSGVSGTDFVNDGNLPTLTTFFNSSQEATDGIGTTGTAWNEVGGPERMIALNTLSNGSDQLYLFLDGNANNVYNSGEDILMNVSSGVTAVAANGNTIRTFDTNERLLLSPVASLPTFTSSNGVVVLSDDAALTAGALDGTGTDRVLTTAAVLTAIPSSVRYFDHDTSGSYVAGDDIVRDLDASGYYNADDLLSLAVTTSSSLADIDDTYLSKISLYQQAGSTCAGSGTDTLIGTDTSAPFLNQAIVVTKAPYVAVDPVISRTICVYADITNNSVHGKIWSLVIPTNGAVFSSGTSPTSPFSATASPVQFAAPLTVAISPSQPMIARSRQTTTYTFTYTLSEDAVPNGQGLFTVTFPPGYATNGATASCTDDGNAVSGTATVGVSIVSVVNASGATVGSGSVIVCTVNGVINPSLAGLTSQFRVGAYTTGVTRMTHADVIQRLVVAPPGSGVQIKPTLTILSPNGAESFVPGADATILWKNEGVALKFVNLTYSEDAGQTWKPLADGLANTGQYRWLVPQENTAQAVVKIVDANVTNAATEDVSDALFTIGTPPVTSSDSSNDEVTVIVDTDPATETAPSTDVVVPASETSSPTSTLATGIFIRLADAPTIYFIDEARVRHPVSHVSIFLTYTESLKNIITIDRGTFDQSTPGSPLLPRIGSIMVRFTSSPYVYTMNAGDDGSVVLRRLPSEDLIRDVLGEQWQDFILTLDDTLLNGVAIAADDETEESFRAWVAQGFLMDRWHLIYPDASEDLDGDGAAAWLEAQWGTNPYLWDTDGDGFDDREEQTLQT